MYDKNILRILDANINRAQEGVRVLEDTARMLFNDESLTRSIKDIRHQIQEIVNSEKDLVVYLCDARGSEYDVLRNGYVDMVEAGIIDPAKVTKGGLENAASIAAMILTTEALITDKPEKKKRAAAMPPAAYDDY